MVKINLLPVRAAAKRESLRAQAMIAVLMLIALFALIGFLHMSITGKIDGLNEDIKRTQAELTRLNKIKAKVDKFKANSKMLAKKLDVIKKLNYGRTDGVKLMDELSNVIPEGLWLESLKGGKKGLTLQGISLDHDAVAAFMTRMEKSDYFTNIKLKSTKKKVIAGENVHQFDLFVIYQPPVPEEKGK
ncbi:MAG: PilN domain-containing protein [Deltaproteobacteria bacterium]|nr:PilN domain-containing protein [Deltaproteobacteria bacterium]